MLKKSIISFSMIGVVALAVASSGGGEKKESTEVRSGLLSLKASPGVTLKAGPNYTRNHLNSACQFNIAMQQAIVTYRKGNTIYILPAVRKTVKTQESDLRSNLNLLKLRFQLHK